MNFTITLSAQERKTLLDLYRHATDRAIGRRAHILLLLADGYTWATIAAVLFVSTSTIARWQQRFRDAGLDCLAGQRPGPRAGWWNSCAVLVVRWVRESTPRSWGLLRSRWTCATAAFVLATYFHLAVSRETVRRWLHQADLVWRRPRPVLRRQDPQRRRKLRTLRRLLRALPADEVAVFQDEVDINLNPKIGPMWMRRGQQAEVETPGDNDKRYLAGSLNWRTGTLWTTEGKQRDGKLFVRHLEDLRRRLRSPGEPRETAGGPAVRRKRPGRDLAGIPLLVSAFQAANITESRTPSVSTLRVSIPAIRHGRVLSAE
jgi:transposase